MKRLPLVYTAGPITKPDMLTNLRRATRLGNRLVRDGKVAPIVPHWGAWAYLQRHVDYEIWMHTDLNGYVLGADALLRIPGESAGADREVALAEKAGIPVFHTVNDLYAWADEWVPPRRRRAKATA